jgi:hypothetical protein
MKDNIIIGDIIDELYSYYESEISLQNVVYTHPMFYNNSFSKNNQYHPPKPNELMTKDEFILKMKNESCEYRWNTALQVLYNHISKTEFNKK